jgi:hypothetical protein
MVVSTNKSLLFMKMYIRNQEDKRIKRVPKIHKLLPRAFIGLWTMGHPSGLKQQIG